jgi:hypothetical protein
MSAVACLESNKDEKSSNGPHFHQLLDQSKVPSSYNCCQVGQRLQSPPIVVDFFMMIVKKCAWDGSFTPAMIASESVKANDE